MAKPVSQWTINIRCENCKKDLGNLKKDHAQFAIPSKGAITYKKGIFGRVRYFCSIKCREEWKSKNE